MSTSVDTAGNVRLGFWINHSHGIIRGSTLTLSNNNAALLTAAVALFVAYAGTRIWRILTFALYLFFANASSRNAFCNQRQAILRNSSTPLDAALSLWTITWTWRKKVNVWHLAPLIALAMLIGLALTAAGVFSSRISSSTGNEVLLNGKDCGWISPNNLSNQDVRRQYGPYISQLQQSALQRAQQCYSPGSRATVESCPTFVKANLPFTMTRNASCPFQEQICQNSSANLIVDTGYLNSHDDFGINAPLSERALFRTKVHCAPLKTEEYSELVNVTLADSKQFNFKIGNSTKVMQYYYGTTLPTSFHLSENLTYQYPVTSPGGLGLTDFGNDYTLA